MIVNINIFLPDEDNPVEAYDQVVSMMGRAMPRATSAPGFGWESEIMWDRDGEEVDLQRVYEEWRRRDA